MTLRINDEWTISGAEKSCICLPAPLAKSIAEGAAICDSPSTLLQPTYAQYARLDARPHEKTFQTWPERIGIHG
jgi:hypothetical protein